MRSSMVVLFGLVVGTVLAVLPPALKPSGSSAGASGARARIVFTVWGMPFEDRLFEDRYARGFERVNPDVRVEYQRHADPNMKYNAWHAAGVGPEVMRVQVTDYHHMVDRGMLEPLDTYISGPGGLTEEEFAVFPPNILDALRVDGKLYALPEDNAQFGLYYNKSLIDAHDAAHPDDPIGYADESWDWARLRDAARKLTSRDTAGNPVVYGFDMDIWAWPFMNFFAQAGGRQWSEDGLTTLINSPAGVEVLEYFRGLVEDGSWSPYFGLSQGTGPDSRFKNGQVAFYMNGSWMVPNIELNAPGLDFAVAPVPRGKVRAVACGSCLWSISAHAEHKEEGWRMLRWLVGDEQAAAYWDALRVAPPANLRVVNSEGFKQTAGIAKPGGQGYEVPPMPPALYPDRAAWLRYAVNPLPETGRAPGFIPTSLYQRKLEDEIMAMLQTFLRSPQTVSPQEVLDKAARAVHLHIDQDRGAKGLPAAARGPGA